MPPRPGLWEHPCQCFPHQFPELVLKLHRAHIEVKAYMFLGYSRLRLKEENMPSHEHIKEFSQALLKSLPDYKYKDECADSRIVLLKKQ